MGGPSGGDGARPSWSGRYRTLRRHPTGAQPRATSSATIAGPCQNCRPVSRHATTPAATTARPGHANDRFRPDLEGLRAVAILLVLLVPRPCAGFRWRLRRRRRLLRPLRVPDHRHPRSRPRRHGDDLAGRVLCAPGSSAAPGRGRGTGRDVARLGRPARAGRDRRRRSRRPCGRPVRLQHRIRAAGHRLSAGRPGTLAAPAFLVARRSRSSSTSCGPRCCSWPLDRWGVRIGSWRRSWHRSRSPPWWHRWS